MIELGDTTVRPIETWAYWPLGTLLKGDIVRVSWSYDGVHGPVYSEDTYLLVECTKKETTSEHWKCFVIISNLNGEQVPKPAQMREHNIYSEDFELTELGDWQRVSLMARAEDQS